jgi:hypothetical protein
MDTGWIAAAGAAARIRLFRGREESLLGALQFGTGGGVCR